MSRFALRTDSAPESIADRWLGSQPIYGIQRGLLLVVVLLAARRLISDSGFVVLAQVLAIVLTAGAFATGRRRGHAVANALDQLPERFRTNLTRGPTLVNLIALVGVLGSATLVLSPTILAYNSRPDDMVAAVLFAIALYRLPFQLAQSFAPRLSRLLVERDVFFGPILWLAPIGLIAPLFAAGFAALTGPLMFDFLVGDGEVLERPIYSAIAATTTIAAINFVCLLGLAGRASSSRLAKAWLLPALIVVIPVIRATEPEPLVQALELYVAMVYLAQLWIWSRARAEVEREGT